MRVGRGERERERLGEPRARTPVDQSKSEKEKERDSDELRKGKEIKREKKPLTLTIPNRSNRRTGKENQNRRGKKGKGVAYLAAVQRCCHAGAREKKGRTGAAARWARKKGRRGQAARRRRAHPLGSALADEGAGKGAGALCSLSSPFRPLDSLGCRCRCAGERGEERGKKAANELDFRGRMPRRCFDRPISPHSCRIVTDGAG